MVYVIPPTVVDNSTHGWMKRLAAAAFPTLHHAGKGRRKLPIERVIASCMRANQRAVCR
jgi:hypothetical protein